jgi:hypothetical protein
MRKRLLLFAASCLLSLLIAEVVLRIHNPFPGRVRGDQIVLGKNVRFTFAGPGNHKLDAEIAYSTNSLGLRGPEPPPDFDAYTSIITVGGSTTECRYLSDDKTWPAQLARSLRRSSPKVWVNNAGLDGHSTFGHAVLLQDYVLKLKPKFVLLLVGWNDVGLGAPREYDREQFAWRSGSLRRLLISAANHSEVLTLGLIAHRSRQAWLRGKGHGGMSFDIRKRRLFQMTEREVSALCDHHSATFLSGYEQRLKKLVLMTRQAGSEPMLMTQTTMCAIGVDAATGFDFGSVRAEPDMNCGALWRLLEIYNDSTRRIGRETGTKVIDLARLLPRDENYFYDMVHFSNPGAVAVGEIAANSLAGDLAASREAPSGN